MKKNTTIILISLLICTLTFAQDKGYVAFSMGTGIPNENFASKDLNNKQASFAKPGLLADVTLAYKLGKYLGFAALFRMQNNGVDTDGQANTFSKRNPNLANVKFASNNWVMISGMGGLYGSFPISEKVSFETKALIGITSAKLPYSNGIVVNTTPAYFSDYYPYTSNYTYSISSVSALSLSYLLGVGLKFNVAKRLCILTNVDYMFANPEFRDIKTTYPYPNPNPNYPSQYSYNTQQISIQTINLSIGIGFRI